MTPAKHPDPSRFQRSRPHGIVLVVVLWILIIMTVLVLSVSLGTRLDNTARVVQQDRLQARSLARAGVARAIKVVVEDDPALDSLRDDWADNPGLFRDAQLPAGTYTLWHASPSPQQELLYGIEDEAAKLNILYASDEQVARLPEMNGAEAQILLRWLKATPPGPQRRQSLKGQLATLRQLATLDDFSLRFLYGEDLNLNGRLDPGENDGLNTAPPDNQNGKLERGLLAWLTCTSYDREQDAKGEPRVNINEADSSTLRNQLNLPPEVANWIVYYRPFDTIADLLADDPLAPLSEVITETLTLNGQSYENRRVISRVSVDLFRQIADRITAGSESVTFGRVNVNTAARETLAAAGQLSPALADRIVRFRDTLPLGFADRGALLDVPGMTRIEFKQLLPWITVRSSVFRIIGRGQTASGGQFHEIEAIVDRGTEKPRILYWKESD